MRPDLRGMWEIVVIEHTHHDRTEIFAINSTWASPPPVASFSEVFSRIINSYSVVGEGARAVISGGTVLEGAIVLISGGTVLVGAPPTVGTAISWA